MARRIQVEKIDLDTCGTAFLLGVTREDEVEVLRGGQASQEDLADPAVLCIEVGGSGRVDEGNFDHHGAGSEGLPSAVLQAWYAQERCLSCGHQWGEKGVPHPADFNPYMCEGGSPADEAYALARMVEYIDLLDTQGPEPLRRRQRQRRRSFFGRVLPKEDLFPTLSDVFTGMLLTERDPVEQLHSGVEILRELSRGAGRYGPDSFGRMPIERVPRWAAYAEAKAEHNRLAKAAVEQARWQTTSSGLRMASVESRFIGAIGSLYGAGAQVAVVLNPAFEGVKKFTVAGNGVRMDAILPELSAREPGWGGPATGTILGSPRGKDSVFSLREVAEIVRKGL